ncbi:hypothetical protein LCGC14_1226520 [marine sediment metagenome]|uniref:glutamine--fructose-6-phosphate transaminase (isomerizing) n=1 Tax=marine sediment metagenome TaxID=412755 RepID=A0A0F9LDT0_9ZZZZ
MCGIAGVIGKIDTDELELLLLSLQRRGSDATGVAITGGDGFQVIKAGMPADLFVENKTFHSEINRATKTARVALLHTRQATHGDPQLNYNNHPISTERSIIIHNGVVGLDEEFDSIGDTDTEQLLRAIDKYGMRKAISKTLGMLAIAYQDFNNPDDVYLYRHNEPLVYGSKDGNIYFCSTGEILRDAIGEIKCIMLPKNTIYKISRQRFTVQKVAEVKPKVKWYAESWDMVLDDYYGGYGAFYF